MLDEGRILRHLDAPTVLTPTGHERVEIRTTNHPLPRPRLRSPKLIAVDPPTDGHDRHLKLFGYLSRSEILLLSHFSAPQETIQQHQVGT
jgi:hypothetical protein